MREACVRFIILEIKDVVLLMVPDCLLGKSLRHLFFHVHRRVVFSKSSIDETTDFPAPLQVDKKGLAALEYRMVSLTWDPYEMGG